MSAPTLQSLIGELSEGDVLEWITRRVQMPRDGGGVTLGIGDDAAVLRFAGDAVATTDTLVHGPDFRLAWTTGYDLGWKAVAVNVADVAAMGATPTALLVALTLPPQTTLGFVDEFYRGVAAACTELAPVATVAGGDLTVSDTLTVAITALGDLEGRAPITRSGAQPGDIIALAGEQGLAGRGLRVLFERFRDADRIPVAVDDSALTDTERLWVSRQLRPVPPVRLGREAAEGGATAMMDVSDGLVIDARRLARASRVRLDFASSRLGDDAHAALIGGEDHALLATFPAGAALPAGFRPVGTASAAASGEAVTVDGAPFDERGGWDPYQDWDDAQG